MAESGKDENRAIVMLFGATAAVVFFSRMQDASPAKRGIIAREAGDNRREAEEGGGP